MGGGAKQALQPKRDRTVSGAGSPQAPPPQAATTPTQQPSNATPENGVELYRYCVQARSKI